MLTIDIDLMMVAVSRNSDVIGVRAEVGYLNLLTGEIRFPRYIEGRDTIEAAPTEWVEIPKYYGHDDAVRLEFIRDFLTGQGIDLATLNW